MQQDAKIQYISSLLLKIFKCSLETCLLKDLDISVCAYTAISYAVEGSKFLCGSRKILAPPL
jgi:hypothetical protein